MCQVKSYTIQDKKKILILLRAEATYALIWHKKSCSLLHIKSVPQMFWRLFKQLVFVFHILFFFSRQACLIEYTRTLLRTKEAQHQDTSSSPKHHVCIYLMAIPGTVKTAAADDGPRSVTTSCSPNR